MALTTKTQTALVQGQVAAMQAACAQLLDFGVGSVLLAIAQAVGEVALFLQALILQLAIVTRAATSTGSDLDSWMADYGVTRLAAVAASGSVTFFRFSTGSQVVVPTGSVVESADGTQSFIVTIDTTNAAYNAGLGGYVMASGIGSVVVPVQAQTAGSGGNVAALVITVIAGAIPGVDTVANVTALAGGADAESDAALRARFVQYINSRSQGTPEAVDYAIASVQQNIDFQLVENYAYTGTFQPGYFYVVVDDGSGSPPSSLITSVQVAINAARPLCDEFGVFGPVLNDITISMTIAGGNPSSVQAALVGYVNGLGLGGTVEYSRLSQIAYDASAGVTNVTAVLLNGGTADVDCTPQQRAITSSGAVTVNT